MERHREDGLEGDVITGCTGAVNPNQAERLSEMPKKRKVADVDDPTRLKGTSEGPEEKFKKTKNVKTDEDSQAFKDDGEEEQTEEDDKGAKEQKKEENEGEKEQTEEDDDDFESFIHNLPSQAPLQERTQSSIGGRTIYLQKDRYETAYRIKETPLEDFRRVEEEAVASIANKELAKAFEKFPVVFEWLKVEFDARATDDIRSEFMKTMTIENFKTIKDNLCQMNQQGAFEATGAVAKLGNNLSGFLLNFFVDKSWLSHSFVNNFPPGYSFDYDY